MSVAAVAMRPPVEATVRPQTPAEHRTTGGRFGASVMVHSIVTAGFREVASSVSRDSAPVVFEQAPHSGRSTTS